MRTYDQKVGHGIAGTPTKLFHVSVNPHGCIYYNFILLADSEQDAIGRLKANANAMIAHAGESADTGRLREIISDRSKLEANELSAERAYAVGYFDDVRSYLGIRQ
jgi:hypothetical protein